MSERKKASKRNGDDEGAGANVRTSPRLDEKKSKSRRDSGQDDEPIGVTKSKMLAKKTGLDKKFASDLPSIYLANPQSSSYANIPKAGRFNFDPVATVMVPGSGSDPEKSVMAHMINIVCDAMPYKLVDCATRDPETKQYKKKLQPANETWERRVSKSMPGC